MLGVIALLEVPLATKFQLPDVTEEIQTLSLPQKKPTSYHYTKRKFPLGPRPDIDFEVADGATPSCDHEQPFFGSCPLYWQRQTCFWLNTVHYKCVINIMLTMLS